MGSDQNVVFTHRGYTVRHWAKSDRNIAPLVVEACLKTYGLEITDKDLELIEVEDHFLKTGEFWVVTDDITGKLVGTCGYCKLELTEDNKDDQDIDVFMDVDKSTVTVTTEPSSNSVEIRKLYLLPEARGKKLGRAMLQELERHICRRGYKNIYLQTASVLVEANKLYDSAGYVELNRSEVPRKLDDPRVDRIMRKLVNQ